MAKPNAAKVAAALHNAAASVKVLQLPGLQEKGDVSDWLSDGGTKERLIELASDGRGDSGEELDEGTGLHASTVSCSDGCPLPQR